MVRYVKFLAAMVVALFATNVLAWTPPASPKPAGNIADLAHILSPIQLVRLNNQLRRTNTDSANEIGVLIIPSLAGENIRDVGIATANAWGIGKQGLDNGVMIVWSPGDRKIGIETGKGVEGDLPDLMCNDIIRNEMTPFFRTKDYEAGLSRAFTAISAAIEDHRAAVAQRDKENAARDNGGPSSPQTSTTAPQSSSCDISATPGSNQAGLGTGLFWLLLLAGAGWLIWKRAQRAFQENEELDRSVQAHREEVRRQGLAQLRAEEEARRQVQPMPVQSVPSAYTPADEHLRQLQEMARARQEQRQQRQQELEEAVALAAVATTAVAVSVARNNDDDDDSSDDDSGSLLSSSSNDDDDDDSSPDDSFGGGTFGGGGSSDDY